MQTSTFKEENTVKRLLAKLPLLVIGLVIAVVLLEVVLRVADIGYPNFYTLDKYRGFALRPGAEGWWRKEGEGYVKINSAGLRDREHEKAKPPNTYRIAVLGDSMMEALQVSWEDASCSIMEKKLQECGAFSGQKVEVINFGVSNYGTAQELLTLRQFVWDYSPDMVVLTFTANNDLKDNSRALANDADMRPYFTYKDGALVPDMSFLNSEMFIRQQSLQGQTVLWLKNNSRLAQIANEVRIVRAARRQIQQPATLDMHNRLYQEPADQAWTETWRVTEGLISLMRSEVEQRGAKFLVVTLSNGIQVNPDASARQEFMRQRGINDLFYPDNRIKALGEREGFRVEALAPAFQEYAERNKVYLHGFGETIGLGHWNKEGNRLAGELMAQYLCKMKGG